jgi:hypothetical protein
MEGAAEAAARLCRLGCVGGHCRYDTINHVRAAKRYFERN